VNGKLGTKTLHPKLQVHREKKNSNKNKFWYIFLEKEENPVNPKSQKLDRRLAKIKK